MLQRCGIGDPLAWSRLWTARLQQMPLPLQIDPVLLRGFALPLLSLLARGHDHGERPIAALQAPVGAGKSTLARALQQLAGTCGLRLAVASIDDAYRCWSERQQRLAGNPFGVSRVPPGSHDPALLLRGIRHWREGGMLQLPRFDKTLRGGQGDRAGFSVAHADALILEGWLVGYRPVGAASIDRWIRAQDRSPQDSAELALTPAHNPDLNDEERHWLPRWDAALHAYVPLWDQASHLWVIQPQDWRHVLRWRLQAEGLQRSRGQAALPAAEIGRLVRATQASLPAELYQPPLNAAAVAVASIDGRRRCREVMAQARA